MAMPSDVRGKYWKVVVTTNKASSGYYVEFAHEGRFVRQFPRGLMSVCLSVPGRRLRVSWDGS